ncbi:syntaxin-8 isoform X1 [Catharus ustulatus]|uniref:syntaxin-8 isoform X1 n=1 Tax=Catharus ustulatus TaxID=91951 RepID=UPI0014077A3D|nr:syntaxin-8 isoform X1 [Catharus ustulatus]
MCVFWGSCAFPSRAFSRGLYQSIPAHPIRSQPIPACPSRSHPIPAGPGSIPRPRAQSLPCPRLPLLAAARQLAQDIAEKIQERNRCQRSGESSAKVNVAIRTSLQSLREKIEQLRELLLRAVSTRQITQLEGDRRQNLVDDLLTRHRQLEASYRNEGPEPDMSRSSLMAGGAKRGITNPWLLEESEETRGLGFDELRQQQRRIIEEQDAGLDALSSIISRQKQMGQEIGNELDEQNEIIDDLTNLVENTDDRLRTQTRHVKMVDKKSTSCGMLVVIVLLLIAIAVVALWPTG